MAYALLFTNIILYSYANRLKIKKKSFFVFILPIAILLILFLGFQSEVGGDYLSYLGLADGSKSLGYMEAKNEYLFIYLVKLVRILDLPQLIFLFTGIIQIFFLMLIIYEIKKMDFKLYNFFFLYFSLALVFFNQFNGIRQYMAVYIIIYSIFKLKDSKYVSFILLVIIASLFHSSSIFFLVFLLIKPLLEKEFSFNKILLFLIILFVFSLTNLDFVWTKLLAYTKYSSYITSEYFQRTPTRGIITKIPKIVLMLFSAYVIENKNKTKNKTKNIESKHRYLLNMSYISVAVMILSFSSTIIWRFYQFFDFFIIFPVLFLMEDESRKEIKFIISMILVSMLVVKIMVIPQGEYLYNSVFLK